MTLSSLKSRACVGLALALASFPSLARAVVDAPASPNALPEVSQLMSFMDSISGKQVLSGQCETVDWFGFKQEAEMDYILANTGKLPAVRVFDFMFYSELNQDGRKGQRCAERAIQWHKKGGIVSFQFHCKVTANTAGNVDFYTANTSFDAAKAIIDGTPENLEFVRKFDIAAEELKKLQDAHVPVIWRPFHECSGGWFWWGAKGATTFKALWRYLYNRYTTVHGLKNLIWCYNPTGNNTIDTDVNTRIWYPGDDVVDMISLDVYPGTGHPDFAAEYKKFEAFKGGRKLLAMSENGAIPDPDTMFTNGANWTYFATWSGDFILKTNQNSVAFVQKVFNHAKVITLDELPPLYGTLPVIVVQPKAGDAFTGDRVVLTTHVRGSGPLAYQWTKDGSNISGATSAEYVVDPASTAHTGSYAVKISNAGGTVTSNATTLTIAESAAPVRTSQLVNLSTRAKVGTGGDVLIAGFSIAGAGSKKVLIRGVGPRLTQAPFNLSGMLADPYITIHEAATNTPIAANADWELDDKAGITSSTTGIGLWALYPHVVDWDTPFDAAIVLTLPVGNYTATVKGNMDGTGVALVEVYDLDKTSAARLRNLSSRGKVGTGSDQMIAGFVTQGSSEKSFLIRAAGPGLGAFGVPGTLADPQMTLLRSTDQSIIASNDDWGTLDVSTIIATTLNAGGFALVTGSKDSVLLQSVTGGDFTANVTGASGTTGVVLLEVYETL